MSPSLKTVQTSCLDKRDSGGKLRTALEFNHQVPKHPVNLYVQLIGSREVMAKKLGNKKGSN